MSITQVLDASCAANVTYCAKYLGNLAKNLTDAERAGLRARFTDANTRLADQLTAMGVTDLPAWLSTSARSTS